MRTTSKHLAAALASLVAAVSFTACSATPTPSNTTTPPPATGPVTGGPTEQESTSQGFDGEVNTEVITANQMQVTVPKGIKLPESALVTETNPTLVMMADQDEKAVVDAVNSSAKAAGYTVYAETEQGTVLVGHGNAVLFSAGPGVQMLSWGPEAMKDVLSGKA